MNTLIMLIIVSFLLVDLLFGAKLVDVNNHFFDLNNSQAMRGFWCMVVILGHTPEIYKNRIQDTILCFGYIGITFFFLTSSYGLTLSMLKNPEYIKSFWRRRLPKLLIITWLVNLLYELFNVIFFASKFSLVNVFAVKGWVRWIIACYFAFWISCICFKKATVWKIMTSVLVVTGSVVVYFLSKNGVITDTIWPTECYGFIWGMVLATIRTEFLEYFSIKWHLKWFVCLIISIILGLLYLNLKVVPFYGDYLLKIILGIAITCLILIVNSRIEFGNRINFFLGKISFEVYLTHTSVIYTLKSIHNWKYGSLFMVCSMVLTVSIAYCIYVIDTRIVAVVNKYIK